MTKGHGGTGAHDGYPRTGPGPQGGQYPPVNQQPTDQQGGDTPTDPWAPPRDRR